MQMKLKVGSYEISHDPTASTTSGVKLYLPDGTHFQWSEDRTNAQMVFGCEVVAADSDALSVAVKAVTAAITGATNYDLEFQHDAGSEMESWKVSTGEFSRIVGSVETDVRDVEALILMTFNAERIAPLNDGAGDIAGTIGDMSFDFSQDINGITNMSATAVFKDRSSAVAWVVGVRAGSAGALPTWLHDDFKLMSWRDDLTLPGDQPSPVVDSSYNPVNCQFMMTRLPSSLASDSAFDNIYAANYDVAITEREPLDIASGDQAGSDVTISGTLQFKTEKDTTWDSGDTSVTALAALKSAAEAAIDVIISDAETRTGETWTKAADLILTQSNNGEVAFRYLGRANFGNIIRWVESVSLTRTTRDRKLSGSKGDRLFKHRHGPSVQISWSLVVESFSLISPTPPAAVTSGQWQELAFTPGKPIEVKGMGDLGNAYMQSFNGSWEKVNDGSVASTAYDYAGAV